MTAVPSAATDPREPRQANAAKQSQERTAPVGAGSLKGLINSSKRPLVVAHRACHNAGPAHRLSEAPENSLLALEHCIAMGVDMAEIDIRRTLDGHLVIMHDDTVERTTDGRGPVESATLAQLRKLRLRQNLGGYDRSITDQQIPTLDEMLKAAKGRITLNLDVKGPIYAEVVDAVIKAGAIDSVVVKARAGIGSPALSSIPPYDKVPFVPIIDPADEPSLLMTIAEKQISSSQLPVAFELPRMPAQSLAAVRAIAEKNKVELFVNTLGDGYIAGMGSDNNAAMDPDATWGRPQREGVRFFQTDHPEAAILFFTGKRQVALQRN
jgi:glycerophosphoryl diester phosphodiesterase